MKAYKGTYIKANGEVRTMRFVKLSDLPPGVLNEQIKGVRKPRAFEDGKELVYCLDKHSFRVFNWSTVKGEVTTFQTNTL